MNQHDFTVIPARLQATWGCAAAALTPVHARRFDEQAAGAAGTRVRRKLLPHASELVA